MSRIPDKGKVAHMLFVVSGPSGSGKSTLIGRVRRDLPNLGFSVSHTTRAPRPSETDGVDYHFVTPRAFERMIKARRFVEWARVHGHLYGTSKAELERKAKRGDVILDIDVQGARQVRRKMPRAIQVFVMPPVFEELRRRLRRRKEDSPGDIARRLRNAAAEVRAYAGFDYVVVNDDLEKAVAGLKSVILASRLRASAMAGTLAPVLRSFRPRSRPAAKKGKP
ncbi:MAG: guanylate kinase [Candidatus Aminicenantales bacterium]